MREVKSIGINYDRLSYAFLSPIAGFVIVGAIIKNDYSYINNPKFLILLFFLSITLAFYFFLKSFNVLIVDSFGIEFKYLLLPIKSIKKRWTQINSYATVKIKRKGSRHQIIYSRSELWFIDSNDMLVFKTYFHASRLPMPHMPAMTYACYARLLLCNQCFQSNFSII